MRKGKYFLLVMVVVFVLFLLGFNNRIYANNEYDDYNESILSDTEIIESLNDLLQKYMNTYELEDEIYHDETCKKIQVLNSYISLKEQSGIELSEENDEYSELNRYGMFHISPNCTCNELNYFTETPCANCQYYCSVLDGVYAVLAGFNVRGWNLACDLLTHNLSNTVLDSDYYPSADLISVISESSQINEIRYDDKLSYGFSQDEPGWANGIFASTADGDVFNALGKFYYTKNYYSNEYTKINILDRYDWDRGGDSPGGVLINNMVEAQELGILTPFYTCIEIVTQGFSPFSWNYYLNGVIINEYYGSSSTLILPNQIYDLRYHQQNMIYAKVTSIANYAFQYCADLEIVTFENNSTLSSIGTNAFYGCTSLESIAIPSTVTNIGSYAFYGCTSLEEVEVLKENGPITNLGLNAFDNCASNLTITVPTNRLCEYKNTPFWSSYRDKIVPSSPIIDDIDLDCMVDDDVTTYLNAGYNKLYRLDVDCDGWYTISCTSGTHYSIYNSNMVKIAGAYDTYELTLNEGTYYIDIEWEDPTDSGYATLHFLNKGINVSDNITNNILPHLHNVGTNYKAQLKYYNNQGPGFYNISVNAASINPITYYEGTITFYSNYSRTTIINKYSDNNYTLSAKSSLGANNMVMYFPSNGYYYFDVILRTNDLTALTLNITLLTSTNLNLFDLSTSTDEGVELLSNDIKGDYFKKVLLKQSGKFEITGEYKDYSSENAYVLVARIVPSGSSYSLDVRLISVINDNIISASATWNLDPGTYYIGYFNNIEGVEIGISFERKITQYGSYNLISDPNSFEDYGSEVRFNNGSYLGSTLTVGFTRFIYLNYDYILPSYSRLDYYFYSSNENIATISEYGTLLGKSAGTVKIMAVYKSDPSITFVKQFTILADNRVNNLIIYDTDSIDYTGSGQIYQIELDDYNSYFPQISLYNWTLISSSNNYSYSISEWGTFGLYGADIIVIEGTSQLNSKLKIRITITVTN